MVAVLALAEMTFQPMMSTAFAALPILSRIESLAVRQIAWTLGSALGSWCGGAVFLSCHHRGHDRLYWLVLAAVTSLSTTLFMAQARRSAPQTA
ncbi:hypothetical protein ACNTMW_24365 [Planosporangium sp. 12N6]|uniref:hypothetical protein n=1 Tax=Planosporangium spinosum TaxID=3402278 RepID=UPI003CF02603